MITELFPRASGGFKLGLDAIRLAADALGSPDQSFRSVVVAGTVGKGSTTAALATMLKASGARVGLYTSPHLLRFSERFRVDGAPVSDERLVAHFERVKHIDVDGMRPLSFFEVGTLMALLAFAEESVDWAVLEVGIGGRLDATNIVARELSVITRIGLDHQGILGETLDKIAGEKAGIIQEGVPVVVAPQEPEAMTVLQAVATERRSELTIANHWPRQRNRPAFLETAASVAASAAQRLGVSDAVIRSVLDDDRWHLPGRYQWLDANTLVDVAHNKPAVATLAKALTQEGRPTHAVFNVLDDRPLGELLDLLTPALTSLHVTDFPSPRAHPLPEARTGMQVHSDLSQALAAASEDRRTSGGILVVAGSFQLVGAAIHLLTGAPKDPPVRG